MFINPWALLGLAGMALPVIIHLYGRQRARQMAFPSLRLIRAAQRRQTSFMRLRNLLLLLARMLAIALVAMAFARPIIEAGPRWQWLGAQPGAVMVMIDASLSMGLRAEGQTVWDRARQAALELIRGAPRGERVFVATYGESVNWLATEPSRAAAEAAVARLSGPTAERGRLGGALRSAGEKLPARLGQGARIYVVSDLQQTGLIGDAGGADLPRGAEVALVDVSAPDPANRWIESLQATTLYPLAGHPVRLRAVVRQEGGEAEEILVGFAADGEELVGRSVALEPGGSAAVEFEHTFAKVGDHGVGVTLPADRLPADDRRWLALKVNAAVRALVAGPKEAARYVLTALDPPVRAEGKTAGLIRPRPVEGAFGAEDVGAADVVVLADRPRITDEEGAALRQGLEDGRGALVILGPRVDPASYRSALWEPLTKGAVRLAGAVGDAAERDRPLILTEVRTDRDPLSAFAEPKAGDLWAINVYQAHRIEVEDGGAIVLAEYADGTPALVELPGRRGRLIVLNMAPYGDWSDCYHKPAFVPLLHRLVYYLSRTNAEPALNALVGEEPARGPAEPGLHDLAEGRLLAVNVDPAESRLARASDAEVRAALGLRDVRIVRAEKLVDVGARAPGRPVDLSRALLIAAFVLLAVEGVWSWRRGTRGRTDSGAVSGTRAQPRRAGHGSPPYRGPS